MVQVLSPRQKQPTFAEQVGLNDILGNIGARGAAGFAEGIGYEPPEHKRALQLEQLKGQKALQVEQAKQLYKQYQQQEKQQFLERLFGGNQPGPSQEAQDLLGEPNEMGMQQMQGQAQQKQPQSQGRFDASSLSDEAIAAATSIDPNLGRALGHAKDVSLREQTEQRKLRYKTLESGNNRALKTLDKVDLLGQEIPLLEASVYAMEDAIVNGDQSFWSLDNLAEITGLELFRTAKGGQFKTAAKTYFIQDLKASGARPNQFIERQLADALAKVGRSQEANETVIESFKFGNDLKKKYHETARELEKFYQEHNDGLLPASYSRKIEEQMKPYVEMRQKQYESRLHQLAEQEKKGKQPPKLSGKLVDVLGPDGQLYEVDQSEAEFLPEGFRIQ